MRFAQGTGFLVQPGVCPWDRMEIEQDIFFNDGLSEFPALPFWSWPSTSGAVVADSGEFGGASAPPTGQAWQQGRATKGIA